MGCVKMRNLAQMGSSFLEQLQKLWKQLWMKNNKLGLGSACHHAQLSVARWYVCIPHELDLQPWSIGMDFPKHFLKTELYKIIPWTTNYQNEQHRFEEAGKIMGTSSSALFQPLEFGYGRVIGTRFHFRTQRSIFMRLAAIYIVLEEQNGTRIIPCQAYGVFINPVKFLTDLTGISGVQEQEINWKKNFDLWMAFVNEYKNRGGRVTTGSDSGFIFQLYGFAYVRRAGVASRSWIPPS